VFKPEKEEKKQNEFVYILYPYSVATESSFEPNFVS